MAAEPEAVRSHEYGERREVLVGAAIRLVARSGLRALTYRSLAREAGVSHTLIAHHFGSLDAVLDEALSATIDASVADLDLRPSSGRVGDFVADLVPGVARAPENFAFQYQVMLEARATGDPSHRLRLLHDRYRDVLRAALRDMEVPADDGTVELVYAALEGIVFHQVVAVEERLSERAIERLRTVLDLLRQRD
ncbi:MAG: TetR family transcriptional regulator [Aeromicrobium sp.]|uniref:TetR/AcrR family transcriptional regulator n=1 Tax=Aeromicrobium sp. TaxID=1871063 RepID=UPI0026233904|nr:TetR family transcriptional regulator [Aeromicrobium sp.]MDF1706131.1 TetR family transcriptional regulator [Aeromicrobium sp.]